MSKIEVVYYAPKKYHHTAASIEYYHEELLFKYIIWEECRIHLFIRDDWPDFVGMIISGITQYPYGDDKERGVILFRNDQADKFVIFFNRVWEVRDLLLKHEIKMDEIDKITKMVNVGETI